MHQKILWSSVLYRRLARLHWRTTATHVSLEYSCLQSLGPTVPGDYRSFAYSKHSKSRGRLSGIIVSYAMRSGTSIDNEVHTPILSSLTAHLFGPRSHILRLHLLQLFMLFLFGQGQVQLGLHAGHSLLQERADFPFPLGPCEFWGSADSAPWCRSFFQC